MERLSNRKTIDRIATENQIELSNQKKIKAGRAITRIIDIWDPPHFIFELLQNADDAKASIVNYYVGDNGIIFTHNGTDFEENQVVSRIMLNLLGFRLSRKDISFKTSGGYFPLETGKIFENLCVQVSKNRLNLIEEFKHEKNPV